MNKFFSRFKIANLWKNLNTIFSRFTIPVIIIIALTILFYIQLHWEFGTETNNLIFRWIFALIVTFFFSIAVYINTENLSYSKIKQNLFQIVPVVFWILFFLGFKSELWNNFDNLIFFLLSIFGIIGYLFIAPYVSKIFSNKAKQTVYYWYFYKTSVIFLISAILWGLLTLLGIIWIGAVMTLFDLRDIVTDKIYTDWMILALVFFSPIFALTQVPSKKEYNDDKFVSNTFFSFLVKYIAIPFICIYFIILYAYSIKVLMKFQDWPKWEVSWMVIGFSIFGYITYIFSYIFQETNNFIKNFRKYFPAIVIPQLFMLFYAIYLRIMQYDITMNRYFVVVFGIWLAIISLYLIFSKIKYLGFIPFLLAVFTILISIWPWSVYNLPQQRQLVRLESNLIKSHILQNGKIVPLKDYTDIDKDLSMSIYDGIDYLCDFDNCNMIKNLFHDEYVKADQEAAKQFELSKKENLKFYTDKKSIEREKKRKYEQMSKWEIVSKITESIKVKRYFDKNDYVAQTINFSLLDLYNILPLDVSWYSKVMAITNDKNQTNISEYTVYNIEKFNLTIYKDWNIIDTINLSGFINNLYLQSKTSNSTKFSKMDLTYETGKYKILFDNLEVLNPEYKEKQNDINGKTYYYVSGYVLIK